MGKRKMTTIRIDEDLLRKAHDLGLNVSKISENALKEMIRRLEGSDNPEKPRDCPNDTQTLEFGSPGEIRTLVSGSRARSACPDSPMGLDSGLNGKTINKSASLIARF